MTIGIQRFVESRKS